MSEVILIFQLLLLPFQELEKALNMFGDKWEFNHGDGAFYGPKVRLTFVPQVLDI